MSLYKQRTTPTNLQSYTRGLLLAYRKIKELALLSGALMPSDDMVVKHTIAKLTNLQGSQPIGDRGRWNTLPWEQTLIYDCEERTLRLQQESDINWAGA